MERSHATGLALDRFQSEEVASNYGCPEEYAVKPVCEQIVEFAKCFPNLNSDPVLACSKELPDAPVGAEGIFVVPKWQKIASNYNEAVENILDLIGNTRSFCNYRKGELGSKYLRQSKKTMFAENVIANQLEGDYMLIWARFGLVHRGRSVRRASAIYAPHEFGLGAFTIGSMLLSHQKRLVQWKQLHIDCPGDEYSPDAHGRFGHTPIFFFSDDVAKFSTHWTNYPYDYFGSASGFLSQAN